MLFRKSKRVKRLLKLLGYRKNAEKLKELQLSVDSSHEKMILAENNLADMRKKYKALAEQYLADQERWSAIETRLKMLTEKVSSSEPKQGAKMKRKAPSRSELKSEAK